ncbi:hypothetical protein B0H19DRAFT_1123018, partial [Mycena capillaripes]
SLFLLSFTVPIATGDVLLVSSFKASSSLKLLSPHSQATRHMPLPQDDRNICPKTTATSLLFHGSSQQCQVLGQDPSSLPGAGGLSRLLESLPVFPMSSALTSNSMSVFMLSPRQPGFLQLALLH